MKDEKNYSLLSLNTFGIDAVCKRFVEAYSVDEIVSFVLSRKGGGDAVACRECEDKLLIIGGGSNLLFTKDFDGTVFHAAIRGIDISRDDEAYVMLRAGSGEVWDDIVAYCVENNLYGAENLSLIPGEAGASAVQNIGAYGVEVKDLIYKVEAVEIATGNIVEIMADDCDYAYRSSRFKHEWRNKYIITHVTYRLSRRYAPHLDYGNIRGELERRKIQNPTAAQLRRVIIDIRNSNLPDPRLEGNAGSFFMNPVVGRSTFEKLYAQYPGMPYYEAGTDKVKIPAGWMIEQCGWKGCTVGRAGVHGRQALVLVNRGGASGSEILNLCNMIVRDVKQRFGIDIYPEVNIV